MEHTSIEAFRSWFEEQLKTIKPTCIVAISRAAPRLLERCYSRLDCLEVPVITDSALNFFQKASLSSHKVMILDDSVIAGSTMSRVLDKVQSLGTPRSNIVCAAYIVDKDSHFGNGSGHKHIVKYIEGLAEKIQLQYKYSLPIEIVPSFHNFIVTNVRQQGKPYNLDFPILTANLTEAGRSANVLEWMRRLDEYCPGAQCLPVSSIVPYPKWMDVFSVPISQTAKTNSNKLVEIESHSKLRIFLDRDKGTVRFSPIVIIRWNPRKNNIGWLTPGLKTILETVLRNFELHDLSESSSRLNKDTLYALFSLIEFFASYKLFADIWNKYLGATWADFIFESTPSLSRSDLVLAFGMQIAELLLAYNTEDLINEDLINGLTNDTRYMFTVSPSKERSIRNKALLKKCLEATHVHGGQFLSKNATLEDNLIRIFLVLRRVIDETQRSKDLSGSRLREGFPFGDLLNIIKSQGTLFQDKEASLLADCLIDQGIMVPVAKDFGNSWCRVYRAGESVDSGRMTKTKIISTEGLRLWDEKNPTQPLSEFDLNKILVILSELFPDELPINKRTDVFGFRPYLGDQEVIEWLANLGALTLDTKVPEKRK